MIKLLPHIGQLVGEPGFYLFTPLVEVELDLTQSLEPSYQIIVEDAKVRERLGLRLTGLLLQIA